eukprot:TRINITY_DN4442_c0_g1_i1.p1 TRINITY_DN4442_c0_g1~~TRINITY_DN4442_c0_g1_i1.p1  ORF type:complete len:237 (+),score=72.97 TRINITY_DN4442_c0_g1_i1:17-727(+)
MSNYTKKTTMKLSSSGNSPSWDLSATTSPEQKSNSGWSTPNTKYRPSFIIATKELTPEIDEEKNPLSPTSPTSPLSPTRVGLRPRRSTYGTSTGAISPTSTSNPTSPHNGSNTILPRINPLSDEQIQKLYDARISLSETNAKITGSTTPKTPHSTTSSEPTSPTSKRTPRSSEEEHELETDSDDDQLWEDSSDDDHNSSQPSTPSSSSTRKDSDSPTPTHSNLIESKSPKKSTKKK